MPRFSANLSWLFTELSVPERYDAARNAGFDAVEILFPYDFEKEHLAEKLEENNLKQILFNLYPGEWDAGERGLAILPERRDEFRDSVARGINYAQALNCRYLHCMAGLIPDTADLYELERTFISNLKYATKEASKAGVNILIEGINSEDMPHYYLNYADHAAEIIEKVGADNLFIQFDFYHQQKMQGNIAATFKQYQPLIRHIQLADNPGRNQPGTGEIHFPFLFKMLDDAGYEGWIGCEYKPTTTTLESLTWLQDL